MTTNPRRINRAILVGGAVAASALTVVVAPGASAFAAKGDNGDVKIHNSSTAVSDQRNEPHVCTFYLDAFNFDSGQHVSWRIESWPPTGNRSNVKSGTLVLDKNGDGHTGNMSLQNGHYKLFWNFAGENGAAKHKVFWVSCQAAKPGKPVHKNLPVTG